MEIKGRNLIEGVPKTLTIDDSEIREALGECFYDRIRLREQYREIPINY